MTTNAIPADVIEAWETRPALQGRRVDFASVMSSTNDRALTLATEGAPDGTTVIADRQTAGRGRRGRSWHSPPARGLYMSVILRTRLSPIITLLAGVAVAEAIRHSVGARTELKWPNDVVVRSNGRAGTGHRKLAGILAEALPAEHGPVGLVLGIGVNLGAGPFPDELHDTAIALETVVGRPVSRGDIGAEVLVRLDTWRKRLAESGPAPIVDRWRQLSPLSHGATVSWDASPARRRGRTAGVDENGALLVECDGGHERIVGGELVWES